MFVKSLLIPILILACSIDLLSQKTFLTKLDSTKSNHLKLILSELNSNEKILKKIKGSNVLIVPFLELNASSNIHERKAVSSISFNKIHKSYDVTLDSIVYVIPTTLTTKGTTIVHHIADTKNSIDDVYYPMVKFCSKFSKDIFLLSLRKQGFSDFAPSDFAIVYVSNNKLKFVDRSLRIYNGLEEYVNHKYGSMEKFREIIMRDSIKSKIYHEMNIENCKKFFKKDYKFIIDKFPKDSSTCINLFLNRLDSFTKTSKFQILKIKNELFNDSSYWYSSIFDEDFDIKSKRLIKQVLTYKQYSSYEWNLDIYNNLKVYIWNKLRYYYENENLIILDDDDIYFKSLFLKLNR